MYKITVTNPKGFVDAVYFNSNAKHGLLNAKLAHGSQARYRTDALYMNPATGSVDTYDGWWYDDEDGMQVNAVERGEVIAITEEE